MLGLWCLVEALGTTLDRGQAVPYVGIHRFVVPADELGSQAQRLDLVAEHFGECLELGQHLFVGVRDALRLDESLAEGRRSDLAVAERTVIRIRALEPVQQVVHAPFQLRQLLGVDFERPACAAAPRPVHLHACALVSPHCDSPVSQ